MSCRSAMRRMVSMMIWLWSAARLAETNSGASSYCAGATSLCSVLQGTPMRQSAALSSCMKATTGSGVAA